MTDPTPAPLPGPQQQNLASVLAKIFVSQDGVDQFLTWFAAQFGESSELGHGFQQQRSAPPPPPPPTPTNKSMDSS